MQEISSGYFWCVRIHLITLSAEQPAPWTFRAAPDVESLALDALDKLRWSKTMLVNEALRRGIPLLLAEQAKRFASLGEVTVAAEAAGTAQRRGQRRRSLEGGGPSPS